MPFPFPFLTNCIFIRTFWKGLFEFTILCLCRVLWIFLTSDWSHCLYGSLSQARTSSLFSPGSFFLSLFTVYVLGQMFFVIEACPGNIVGGLVASSSLCPLDASSACLPVVTTKSCQMFPGVESSPLSPSFITSPDPTEKWNGQGLQGHQSPSLLGGHVSRIGLWWGVWCLLSLKDLNPCIGESSFILYIAIKFIILSNF